VCFFLQVNWKFLTISLQRKWPHIDLKIREIGVFRDASAQPFIEENRIRRGSRLFSLYDAMDSLQRWLVKYETVLPLHDAAFLQTGYVYDNTRNSFRVHFQFLRRLNREEIKTMYPYQLSVYLFWIDYALFMVYMVSY